MEDLDALADGQVDGAHDARPDAHGRDQHVDPCRQPSPCHTTMPLGSGRAARALTTNKSMPSRRAITSSAFPTTTAAWGWSASPPVSGSTQA
jgi:hypothetical protein